jgi:glutathionylspermidine synthase
MNSKGDTMSKKIKVELTENQLLTVTQALHSHCVDFMADEFLSHQSAMENRVINNALDAMDKGYQEWKEGK